jgi:signal transduction histidine kinase
MKVKVSLSLKLTLIVVLLSIAIILSLSYINIYWQSENEKEIYEETIGWSVANFAESHAALKTLDDNLSSYENLSEILANTDNLYIFLTNLTEVYTDILKININTPVENDLMTIVSTDNNSLGSLTNPEYNNDAYENGNTWYRINGSILTIVSPINISGSMAGTYEIGISMFPQGLSHDAQIQYIVLVTFISILILIFSLLYLLRRAIVKPIIYFRNTARIFGKGDLDAKVEIDSKDELGDLASAFNQMAIDLKESRDKIQDYNQILENLLQQKDEFIGQLGHDLKNPLQPLVGLLPVVIEEEKDPKIKETLVVMNENVEYMQDLIFKTLQLAKLRSSKIKFDFENLDLKKEADHVNLTEKINLKEHKIDLENKIDEGIIIKADKLRLAEVFKNLITNAVKYTPEGGGKITIDAKKGGDIVTVSVQDTGVGMAEDQIKKVFDEFYKVDVTTSDYKSSGLGLAICKRIIEKHDGKIWVESPGPGKGSTFYFTLKSWDEK